MINEAVGNSYGFLERFRLKGIGSPKLFINEASTEIDELLVRDKYINSCNVELRPRGIVVRFRSVLDTYALVIPYFKLTLYKGKEDEYSIYADHHFLKIQGHQEVVIRFFRRLIDLKVAYFQNSSQLTY